MMGGSTFFEHIVFDLDDTLLDTTGALVPQAARRACQAMIAAGLPCTIEQALASRSQILNQDPRAAVWMEIAKAWPTPTAPFEAIARTGHEAFYRHPIASLPESALRLTAGAGEILKYARARAEIHLITSGYQDIQEQKLAKLGIRDLFHSIQIVAPDVGAKSSAFLKVQERANKANGTSGKLVSVGNRVDTDLAPAKALGWQTVWIRYGEHVTLTPKHRHEMPDFEVASPAQLLALWQQQFPKESEWIE